MSFKIVRGVFSVKGPASSVGGVPVDIARGGPQRRGKGTGQGSGRRRRNTRKGTR